METKSFFEEVSRPGWPIDFYACTDCIGEEPIIPGDYEIQFPDGTIEEKYIQIQKISRKTQVDMNFHPDRHTESKAYFENIVHGSNQRVYLYGSGIKIRKIYE